MMNIKSIFIFTFLALHFSVSAINIDSLKNEIKKLNGTEKQSLLCQSAAKLISLHKLNDAQNFADEALQLAQQSNDAIGQSKALEQLGLICKAKSDYTNAIKYLLDALRLKDTSKDHKDIAGTITNIGQVFLLQHEYVSAIQQFTKALEYWQAENDKNGIAETSKLLGDTYVGMKVYGKAKDNYQRAMDLWIELEQHQKAADIASGLGDIVIELADYDGAITYYQTSLDLNTTTNNLPKISQDLRALAKIHLQQGNFDESEHFLNSAKALATELKDSIALAEATLYQAQILLGKNKKHEAIALLESGANILRNTADKEGKDVVFLLYANAAKEMGKTDLAFALMQDYNKAKDAIAALNRNKTIMELTARYESEFDAKQKQQQIELLSLEKSNNQKTIGLLLALALGAGMIGFLLFRNNKQRKKDNLLLQAKNNEISTINAQLDANNAALQTEQDKVKLANEKLRHEMAEREAVEKNSFDRDNFLVNISNQMRSPLNVISGLSHLLLEQNPQPEQTEHLRTLQFSANSLMVFINDMLDFSKIEAGKLNPDTREFESIKLLTEVKDRFGLPMSNKGLGFNYGLSDAIPTKLIGDPARLNQILTNLLNFSLQQTQVGSVNVKIDPVPISGKGMNLEIIVTDTSSGMPQYKMDELLRKFSYNATENLDTTQATFGLSIMKRLVELQNGTVEASSVEGMGNKFRIILPFKLTETKVVSLQNYENQFSFPGAKILVVEDNRINQMVVVKLLQKAYAKVSTADNGVFALEKVKNEDFDLILMDIQMPEMDGYRATSEIRKLDSETKKNIPIIALTASPYLSETEKAQLFGMNDYVGKPFSPDELLEKISRFLNNNEKSAAV